MKKLPLPPLHASSPWRARLLPWCRLQPGGVWHDPTGAHCVACLDATDGAALGKLLAGSQATLAVHDPPYNVAAFAEMPLDDYLAWCRRWLEITDRHLAAPASLYVWLGADPTRGFQPLPDFMLLLRQLPQFQPRSFLTMRNQRGYGTQKNWMAVRQELLYYVKQQPVFHVQYTEIPKILRGYYKQVGGERTENLQRGKSPNIRPGNVWVDIQQVFYRMQENVSGCYAQKPLQAIERIVAASSDVGDLVLDFFAHAGTTLLACERLGRRCVTVDVDPLFCEITIRRLLHYRTHRLTGWQNSNPFEAELEASTLAPP